jgi:hypothetical protein
VWFEEGFCFYLPRKHLLPAARFAQLLAVEKALIDAHHARLGEYPTWQFGLPDQGAGFTEALFDYWRAIRAVSLLVDTYTRGEGKSMLALFHTWKQQRDQGMRLHEFLSDALGVSEADQQALWLRHSST